ncbi:hypothetical protein CKA32_001148 [Geitlerinema sp. FC II]|nr:hypothetical protein CKA32_001148 [Geitlerinema sp. FC II]
MLKFAFRSFHENSLNFKCQYSIRSKPIPQYIKKCCIGRYVF